MDYEKLKNFISGYKAQLITLTACAVMFVVGFGTGKAFGQPAKPAPSQYSNYTPKPAAKPEAEATVPNEPPAPAATPKVSPAPAKSPAAEPQTAGKLPIPGQPCTIKGNISGKNKIYHIKGGAFYDRVTPEQCFDTETEAQAAGFRKSGR